MEGVPTVMSVVDGGGGGIGGQDNLAFAVSEENGVNYGYIIHLPVDVAMQQELLGNVQDHLIVHQEQVESKHSTIYLPVVTTSTSSNNCGSDTTAQTVVHHQSSQSHHHHHPPIEFQYHLEEIPSSAFIDGQVQVEMSAEVDVKYDTLNFTSVQLQQEPLSQQLNSFSEHDLVRDILSDQLSPSIIPTPHHQQNSQVKMSNSPVVPKSISPPTTARTYGKPKPVSKVISGEEPSQKNISQDVKTILSSSSSPIKVTRVHQVSVKETQRVSVPIPVRKRRLILDPQRQIPIPEFKRQLLNTKDIVNVRSDLAPGTKQAMKCLELGGVIQFFSSPGRAIRNVRLSRLFTNHLVMFTNSVGHSSTSGCSPFNVVPLNSDLRVPTILKSEEEEDSTFSKGHNTFNVPSTAYKRLINVPRPVDCLFKGLRKPPVFKEYKRIQRKFPEKMNGNSLKSFGSRVKNKKGVEKEKDGSKVEEVVYTVVEEEGESVVLKSSQKGEEEGSRCNVSCNDPLLLEFQGGGGMKKENADSLFSECASFNGENGEDDLNKLWGEQEQVATSLSS